MCFVLRFFVHNFTEQSKIFCHINKIFGNPLFFYPEIKGYKNKEKIKFNRMFFHTTKYIELSKKIHSVILSKCGMSRISDLGSWVSVVCRVLCYIATSCRMWQLPTINFLLAIFYPITEWNYLLGKSAQQGFYCNNKSCKLKTLTIWRKGADKLRQLIMDVRTS